MNRSVRPDLFSVRLPRPLGRDEAVVATSFTHPTRGTVHCASAVLLGGFLRRAGKAVTYAPLENTGEERAEQECCGSARVHMLTYLLRDGRPGGLAVAAAVEDGKVVRGAMSAFTGVLRSRRIVLGATVPRVDRARRSAAQSEIGVFTERGDTVLLIGQADDAALPALVGRTPGPGTVVPVVSERQAEQVEVADPDRVAVVVQPGLSTAEAAPVAAALRARFPALVPQHPATHCYAADDWRATVRELGVLCEVLLVAGEPGAGEEALFAELSAAPVYFVATPEQLLPEWLAGAASVGVTSAAAAREGLAEELASALTGLGPCAMLERAVVTREAELVRQRDAGERGLSPSAEGK